MVCRNNAASFQTKSHAHCLKYEHQVQWNAKQEQFGKEWIFKAQQSIQIRVNIINNRLDGMYWHGRGKYNIGQVTRKGPLANLELWHYRATFWDYGTTPCLKEGWSLRVQICPKARSSKVTRPPRGRPSLSSFSLRISSIKLLLIAWNIMFYA